MKWNYQQAFWVKALYIQYFNAICVGPICVRGADEGNRTLTTSVEDWGSTIELHPHSKFLSRFLTYILYTKFQEKSNFVGGEYGSRTHDPYLARVVLSHLS